MRIMKSLSSIFVLLLASSAAFADDKPNIVYILVDNWGWADIRVQGVSIPTPRIDALAQEGLRTK
jgi:arylsulfatase A-like enzyme